MFGDITCEDLHLASVARMDDITCHNLTYNDLTLDDRHPDMCENVVLGLMI